MRFLSLPLQALWRVTALCLCLYLAQPQAAAAAADPAAVRELLRERVDGLRGSGAADEIISRSVLPALYEGSGFAPQWSDPARAAALLRALEGVAADGLEPTDYHLDELRALAPQVAGGNDPSRAARFDLLASDGLVLALYHLSVGKVDPKTINPEWNFTARPQTDASVLSAARRALDTGQIEQEFDAARPRHWMYARGREILKRYRAIAAAGGWPKIPAGVALKPGMSDPRIPALRQRLSAEGDYSGPLGSDELYDAPLEAAVKAFQERHLLSADGAIGAGTLKEINVSAAERVEQIRANLERGRWVLHEIGDEDLVLVDIAGYGVRLMHDHQPVWQSRVIVGQAYRQTPSFRAEIEYVVFNPTWTVPPGILAKDILPQMKKGSDVLSRKHLIVVDRQGRTVDPKSIHWSQYTASNFPYFLRQEAGEANALGRVKIMFPNPYLVYLHDTPTRSLFDKDRRNFSSGCIRVEKPLELAERVLADPVNWDSAAIAAAVASGQTRTVNLKQKIPVLLIYWTVDADASGRAVFKPDVYGQDPRLLKALNGKPTLGKRRPG